MALKLIKSGPVVKPYNKATGGVSSTGWQTITFDKNVYQSLPPGTYRFTITGTKCSGVRLYFRSKAGGSVNQYMLDSGVTGALVAPTVSAVVEIKDGDTFFGQVNGETPETQVLLMTQQLNSLSLS